MDACKRMAEIQSRLTGFRYARAESKWDANRRAEMNPYRERPMVQRRTRTLWQKLILRWKARRWHSRMVVAAKRRAEEILWACT